MVDDATQNLEQLKICLRGVRTHNLKNIDLDIPRNQLVVITGLSGSGKSSLVFDTLYAEGHRRYVESLSAYARQFLQLMGKPDVDSIQGLSPAISIEQKATSHNPRSTVGTVTQIHDYLRLLFARAGTPVCPDHPEQALQAQSVGQMVDALLSLPQDTKLMLLAPIVQDRKGGFTELLASLQAQGFIRLRIDGQVLDINDVPPFKKNAKHTLEVVVDRVKVRSDNTSMRQRLAESFESALRLANGRALAIEMDSGHTHWFSSRFACAVCSYSLNELEPRLFSFNSPLGACSECDGLGQVLVFDAHKVVQFPDLSLTDGAVKGWDKSKPENFNLLKLVAKELGVDINSSFNELPREAQAVFLFGWDSSSASANQDTKDSKTASSSKLPQSQAKVRSLKDTANFEGIIPSLQKLYIRGYSGAQSEQLKHYQTTKSCQKCKGSRLRREALHVFLDRKGLGLGESIDQLTSLTLEACLHYFETLQLVGAKAEIAIKVIHEIKSRLKFLNDVGLGYLSLDRSAETLSGGEAQRIRLASQIGSGLTGVMYVLDEPSIGLHQHDNQRLIDTLCHLRDIGNSVLVVEHDEDTIRAADHVIDMGPGAGVHGGRILSQGTPDEIMDDPASITGHYLSGRCAIELPIRRLPPSHLASDDISGWLQLMGACGNNLQNVSIAIPLGLLTCVTGVSGSGKSTLINDTLYAEVARKLHKSQQQPEVFDCLLGLEAIDKVINVDQSPIGRTPRSNPATYTGLLTPIRELFAEMPLSRERGYSPGRFSFNVAGGRCEPCQGDGVIKVEMHFLPDVYVPCDICRGQRYNRETLEVFFKGKNIHEILSLTVEDAFAFFSAQPPIARKLQSLLDVGLGYITLGQNATTLSGGEAQRVKLALELSKRDTGRTLYILDEPTTGLHFADIALLLKVLRQLREAGNTVIVIEHNLEVIKTADWLIDMGPGGGSKGGRVVAMGPPEHVAAQEASFTGKYLAKHLTAHR